MKKLLFCTSLLAASISSATAGQFDSLVSAMAIPVSAPQTNNSWEDTGKVKEIRWAWPYNQSGAHDHTMVGTTWFGKDKNPNIGKTEVAVSGTRSYITAITITVDNETPDIKEFGEARITKIATDCDDDSVNNTVAFYQFAKPGYKPLYMSYHASFGAGSGSTEYKITYDLIDSLEMFQSDPCKLIK